MSRLFIVVESHEDWSPYFPSEDVVTFDQYLQSPFGKNPARVINLCRNYNYLSQGYYCSLLAESRGDKVIPRLKDLGRLSPGTSVISTALPVSFFINDFHSKFSKVIEGNEYETTIYFGHGENPALSKLFRKIYERYEFPIIHLKFNKEGQRWFLEALTPGSLNEIEDNQEDRFGAVMESSISLMWRQPRRQKKFKYDLAILINPEEKLPPSCKKALKNFVTAGQQLSIECSFITKDDFLNIAEYDGLFIRETTAVNHHTFKFAQKAEEEGVVVVDDPTSILKCSNKVFLNDLFRRKNIPTPKTVLLSNTKEQISNAIDLLGLPMVLKVPDGAFSKGVFIVHNELELFDKCNELFDKTHLLIAQEFMYTEFDWRIGVFGNRPLFACQYFMARGHWQIYDHSGNKPKTGGFKTVSLQSAPQQVVKTALNAVATIGDGLYGVDLKQVGDKLAVIEVNDNPNIDADVEDAWLGKDLYHMVMQEFLMRMEKYHYGF